MIIQNTSTIRTIATSHFCIWNCLDNLLNSHAKMSVWSRVESGSYLTHVTHQVFQMSVWHTNNVTQTQKKFLYEIMPYIFFILVRIQNWSLIALPFWQWNLWTSHSSKQLDVTNDDSVHTLPLSDPGLRFTCITNVHQETLTNLTNLGQIVKLKSFNIKVSIHY